MSLLTCAEQCSLARRIRTFSRTERPGTEQENCYPCARSELLPTCPVADAQTLEIFDVVILDRTRDASDPNIPQKTYFREYRHPSTPENRAW
jgi:hypothetical protein